MFSWLYLFCSSWDFGTCLYFRAFISSVSQCIIICFCVPLLNLFRRLNIQGSVCPGSASLYIVISRFSVTSRLFHCILKLTHKKVTKLEISVIIKQMSRNSHALEMAVLFFSSGKLLEIFSLHCRFYFLHPCLFIKRILSTSIPFFFSLMPFCGSR